LVIAVTNVRYNGNGDYQEMQGKCPNQ